MPRYKYISSKGARALVPRHEGIRSKVRGYLCQGTRVFVPRYEGICAEV